jgi:ribosomal protein RSM22 (predicted rRNA methylase)
MPGGKVRNKGEKFSYIVAQKRVAGDWDEQPHQFDNVSLVDLLAKARALDHDDETRKDTETERLLQEEVVALESRFLDSNDDDLGLELLRGDRNRSSFGRIIHAPKKKKGHVLIECCTGPGRIVTHSIAKSMSQTAPGLYSAARKSRWGGLWPDLQKAEE